MPVCKLVDPPLVEVRPERWVACHLYDENSVSEGV
jgi:hypothetical protein